MTTSTQSPAAGMTRLPAAGIQTDHGHGSTALAVGARCPCEKCRPVHSAYRRRVYRLQGYGLWQPHIDATQTREHINYLHQAGISYLQIAEQSGLSGNQVRRIAHKVVKQVRTETAEVILALTLEGMRRKVLPATGSARRLQALVAVGWPFASVAPHIGMDPRGITRVIHQPYIFRTTADAIVVAFEQMKNLKPEDNGVSLIGAQKSRRLAERRGWPDPLWWEDMGHIDNPAFDPATAERPLNFHEQARLRAEEILHLASYGAGPDEIAERLGLGRDYVVARLRDLREVAA
ncbi:hypothetical protein ABZ135_38370 [Streptomyces sp. NPDC006339]|uniref:hypothetical protein n=1 Tax=Streptomyces sp. NPDC006339 TaxID=3156755 RepID=UPI0033B16B49